MTSNPARFRYRAPDGSEVSVASAQELAERVEVGDVEPDTPLYDASVGQWVPAGENPVFRFVVEELQSEGKLEKDPNLPFSPDPFEMHYPLRSVIPGTDTAETETEGDTPEAGLEEEVEDDSRAEVEEGFASDQEGEEEDREVDGARTRPDPFSSVLPADWGQPIEPPPPAEPTPSPEDWTLEESLWGDPPEEPTSDDPPEKSTSDDPPEEPTLEEAPDWEEASGPSTAGERDPPKGEREGESAQRADPRPFAVRPVAARPSRLPLVILVSTGVVILLAATGLLLRGGSSADPPVSPVAEEPVVPVPNDAIPEPPDDLAGYFPGMTADLSAVLSRHADSLWAERSGLEGPPPGWLGGYYLANASEFPEVESFWSDYGAYVELLRDRDAEIYREAVDELLMTESWTPAVEARLREYLDARYAGLAPLRLERYEQLGRVAVAAGNLHAFLVRSEARIAYAPALGRGISADPILEAVPLDEETRRTLDGLLDQLFQALDRSRGGGAPSREGLRAELHGQFGRPV